ncbi:hypothetical protein, partial [Methanosarcina mazei]|uniref:hypothetical protein n=1 Tax=Methanosarcina mazei TaxID=2209 RepID=UPI00064F9042
NVSSGITQSFNLSDLNIGRYKLRATVIDPHNESSTDSISFDVIPFPLAIDGNVEPNPVYGGYWVTITANTTGYAEEVIATILGGKDTGMNFYMSSSLDVSQKENTWTIKYKTWEFEPDGPIPVELKARRMIDGVLYEETTIVNIIIKDSYLEHRKSRVLN